MPSKEIAKKLLCSEHKVVQWVKRYFEQGVDGLRNKPGQGAKPIMDSSNEEAVRLAIEKDRLSVMKAKERWQQATSKEACRDTYRAFLSALAQDLDI
ncbi:helix-turn-helix domain-containing protein [Muribaculaceae bacterium Isolate-080 (Janvier)]|nr:helix-turn-helix domain-containing protein [Muribaculaceae bacterium Isolate-080 (Janvier)]